LQFNVRQNFADSRIGGAGLVACKDAFDHGAVALAHIMCAEIFELLGVFFECRRLGTLVRECRQYETIDVLRFDCSIKCRAQCS
jgi:hypothetical protein